MKKWTIEYSKPELVTKDKVYIIGERFCDDRFVGYIYHYGRLAQTKRGANPNINKPGEPI